MSENTQCATSSVDQRSQRDLTKRSRAGSVVIAVASSLQFRQGWVVNLLGLVLAGCLISVFYLRGASMIEPTRKTMLGLGVNDGIARISNNTVIGNRAKVDCDIEYRPGGLIANAAAAFCDVAAEEPELLAIVGPDRLAKFLADDLNQRFSQVQFISTADRTRASCIVPAASGPAETQQIFTMRSVVDQEATIAAVDTLLNDCRYLLMGSMTAADDQLVNAVLDRMKRQPGSQTYLVLTSSQLASPQRAVELALKATWVQVNDEELETWTGVRGDVVAGINRLREWGLRSIIVTAGKRGVYWYVNGWGSQPTFAVTAKGDLAAGDTFTGTTFAGIAEGLDLREAIQLGAAAAAMKVGGLKPMHGWDELREFVATTPVLPLRPKQIIRRPLHVPEKLKIAGSVAAGAAAASIVILLSTLATT